MHRITQNRWAPVDSPRDIVAPHDHAIKPLSVRIATAVQITGIGRSKLYELIQAGEIEVIKIGSATLIPVDSLQRLLDRHRR